MNGSRVARNLRNRIGQFSGDLSQSLCLPAQRFVSEMVYGIQASGSVMLTEVGRALEEGIASGGSPEALTLDLQPLCCIMQFCSN